ncbi:hypothetical protein TRFO_41554 [Tritrichomonas foetus]|uniref:Uncharacterized protein n=1 Tax=Tritrichomonas foetus TaxID=1144522 RepID=A0A1J4KZV5_9EUKA|nr:hypothetical protein TRFO_41554 [Tritrichomonas foetus]|eukprot:OHT16783.1 hypothetical protein TRFO_41554 [Tritrichomonas foetus]
MSSPKSPSSPRRHHHVDEKKQVKLDEETENYIERVGGLNHFQAQFHAEVAQAAINSELALLQDLKPQIKDLKRQAWKKAFCLSLAFIKRYKMRLTVDALKVEYDQIPKKTGFTHGHEVDSYFNVLLQISQNLENASFEELAEQYANELNNSLNQENNEENSQLDAKSDKSSKSGSSVGKRMRKPRMNP